MKTKIFIIIAIFGVVVLINSCAPAYIPNVVNAPLLSNKNEFQGKLTGGTSGFDNQLSYAITDHIGVMLNGSYNYRNDSANYHKHYFIETGVGYYQKLQEAGRLEVFGGYGYGDVKAIEDDWFYQNNQLVANAYYHRIFIQPSLGAVTNVFEGSFSTRYSLVNMHFREGNTNDMSMNNSYISFLEPAITVKLGYKYVKYVAQIGFSVPIYGNTEQMYSHQPFIFSMGINVKIGQKYLDDKK